MSSEKVGPALWAVSIIVAILFVAFFLYIGVDILTKGVDKPSEWLITQPFVVLGRDFWFGVGLVLWLAGTVLFFMELLGWTIKRGKFVKQIIKWDAVDVSITALCAAVYGGALAATGGIPKYLASRGSGLQTL